MSRTEPVLRIERLYKAFGPTEVLRGIDLAEPRVFVEPALSFDERHPSSGVDLCERLARASIG